MRGALTSFLVLWLCGSREWCPIPVGKTISVTVQDSIITDRRSKPKPARPNGRVMCSHIPDHMQIMLLSRDGCLDVRLSQMPWIGGLCVVVLGFDKDDVDESSIVVIGIKLVDNR